MKSETGACYACMFLLRWTPCWPVFGSVLQRAGLVWLRVRGPERGKGGRVWRSQLQNVDAGTKRSRKNKRGVQLSPTHALRLQTLKRREQSKNVNAHKWGKHCQHIQLNTNKKLIQVFHGVWNLELCFSSGPKLLYHKTNLSPLIHQQATLLFWFSAKHAIQHFSFIHSFLDFFMPNCLLFNFHTPMYTLGGSLSGPTTLWCIVWDSLYTSTSIYSSRHTLKSLNGVTIANISDIVFVWLCYKNPN